MNRRDFINELRISMSGHFSPNEIQENVDYYQDYIDMQIRKGRTEEEVLRELGDPRLLTKSMRAAGKGNRKEEWNSQSVEYESDSYDEGARKPYGKIIHIPMPVWIILFLVVLLIIGLLVSAALAIVMYALPFVIGGILIYGLYRYFLKK